MAHVTHAQIGTHLSGSVEMATLACGRNDIMVQAGLTEVSSDYLTCKRCLAELGRSMDQFGSALREAAATAVAAHVLEDAAVKRAKAALREDAEDVLRLLDSATRDVRRELERIDQIGTVNRWTDAGDIVGSLLRVSGFIATNVNAAALIARAFDLDNAVRAARREARKGD